MSEPNVPVLCPSAWEPIVRSEAEQLVVNAEIQAAIQAEREACAKIVEEFAYNENWSIGAKIVALIRARSEA